MTDANQMDFHRPFSGGIIASEAERRALLDQMRENKVHFLRLIFTDIMGQNKNVEVPESQFAKALRGEIMFDGSSIEGFSRIEESDMLLVPDLRSYAVFPFSEGNGKVARLICDVYNADRTPFAGCPRLTLQRTLADFKEMGLVPVCGPELEFFLFLRDAEGNPTVTTHDTGGYFDLLPVDRGEDARRTIVSSLEAMGFEIEAAHHEVAPGQHEIDFKYAEALETADRVTTFRLVVKKIALDYGLHATFMPKPLFGVNGSGMHTHQSLFLGEGDEARNVFFDENGPGQLSDMARHYIGGLLEHTLAVTKIVDALASVHPRLDRNLALTGAILHDIGKIREFATTTSIDISEEGMLRGHVVIGEQMVLDKIKEIEGFPTTLKLKIAHMILSHHKELEWGAPKKPQFAEAVAIHYADDADAKLYQFITLKENAKTEDPWIWDKRIGHVFLK